MATESVIWSESFSAINSLTQFQLCAVATSAARSVKMATSATGDRIIGVVLNAPSTVAGNGLTAEVGILGTVPLENATGAINIGDRITTSTHGQAWASTGNLQNIVGFAISGTTVQGAIFTAMLMPLSIQSTAP